MAEQFSSYSIENDRIFQAALNKVRKQATDLTIPLTLISKDFYKSERAIFKLKGPGQYPDLSTKPFTAWWEKDDELNAFYPGGYKEYKEAKYGFIYPILKRSGALERSVTDPRDANAINQIVNKNTLIIGTKVPYAIFHQSDKPRSKIPLRKFLFIGPESRFASSEQKGRLQRWISILDSYYDQILNE